VSPSLLTHLPIRDNVVCSPLSVHLALGMLLPGARGETFDQIAAFVGTDDPAVLADQLKVLRDDLAGAIRLSITNGVFVHTGFPLLPGYRKDVEGLFRAQVESLDLDDPAAVARINAWVAEATEGMIRSALAPGSLSALTRLLLVNAVYFLAAWREPFEESSTRQELFHALEGAAYEVPMMRQTLVVDYATHAKQPLEAVALPYRGAHFRAPSFVLALPHRGHFESMAAAFGEEDLAGLEWSTRRVELRLPRFELESGLPLTGALRLLGIRAPFQKELADFGALTIRSEGFFLSDVVQAARIRVDERGTEAAAATSMHETGLGADEPTLFHVDRPFLFFVRDPRARSVLFAGRCTAPQPPGRQRGRA